MENEVVGAEGGLKVSTIPNKGRALVATRHFFPGDVIIFQEPYVAVPSTSCCDGCFASGNLKRCSSCRIAWYCGQSCQKSEWKLHQLECQALTGLSESKRRMVTPSMRLMLRLKLKKKLQDDNVISSNTRDNYDLVGALVSHISDVNEKQLVTYAQIANLIKLMLPSTEINLKEVTEDFSRLACNAHTICSSDLTPLGTGLYPVVSIINHSCMPNSVLIFEGRKAVIRAVEHVASGSEILISYIETATTTMKRKEMLKDQYFFNCECPRCSTEDLQLEAYRCQNRNCDGSLLQGSEKVFTCQSCGFSIDEKEWEKINTEVKQVLESASGCLYQKKYMEAANLYKLAEQTQAKLYHPLSIQIMNTREEIIKILMEVEDWNGALAYCRLTIPVYQRIYPATYPVLGLQYYKCGRLEWLVGETEEALKSLSKAVDVLRVTHGTNTPFMTELLGRLEETRAEFAYINRRNDT